MEEDTYEVANAYIPLAVKEDIRGLFGVCLSDGCPNVKIKWGGG